MFNTKPQGAPHSEWEAGKVEGMLIGSSPGIMTPISGPHWRERGWFFPLLIDSGLKQSKARLTPFTAARSAAEIRSSVCLKSGLGIWNGSGYRKAEGGCRSVLFEKFGLEAYFWGICL